MKLARKHNLIVIDDSAETFLAEYNGNLYSNLADITVLLGSLDFVLGECDR